MHLFNSDVLIDGFCQVVLESVEKWYFFVEKVGASMSSEVESFWMMVLKTGFSFGLSQTYMGPLGSLECL